MMAGSILRKRHWIVAFLVGSLLVARASAGAVGDDKKIDWNYARQLYQRSQRGETLTPEEKAYLDRAREERKKKGAGADREPQQRPDQRTRAGVGLTSMGLVPLPEMTTDRYKGEDGGLYGGGHNDIPAAHQPAAQKEIAAIRPLDANGRPSPDGKIVLISIGMSNTTMEFQAFKRIADADPDKSPRLVIVDGAQGGQAAAEWANSSGPWDTLAQRLAASGATSPQVQVAWIKQAQKGPARLGEFPAHARNLQRDLVTILNRLKQRYPNVRIAYCSSRIYAGYAVTVLNPEPYAYEGAFSVRWLIQDQIKGEAALNYDPQRGEVKAPLILWGPYLWADGMRARKADGFTWVREDFGADGTHPSGSGCQKVARLLLKFFKEDPSARPWFLKSDRGAPANAAK